MPIQYKEKKYDVYFPTLGLKIEEYPYYVISLNKESNIRICFNRGRFYANETETSYSLTASSRGFLEIEVKNNGEVLTVINDFAYISINKKEMEKNFIASNHDIFKKETTDIAFRKNSGYEYDGSCESESSCDDIVKMTKTTVVYEKPAIYYNEIAKLETKSIVKRINSKVNEVNGHTWDKIVLSNGKEGYIYSDSAEAVTSETEYLMLE